MSFMRFDPANITDMQSKTDTLDTFRPAVSSVSVADISKRSYYLPIHQPIIERLNTFIATNKIPHIIFHGRSGSGKLTIVKDFIRKIYRGDSDKIKHNVMTVNCSHGKGIQFIREELKFFAKTNIQSSAENTEFKTILLLNAHHLTVDAQSALRRCIELFSYNTRFIIIVENRNKLLNPILSRFCDIYVPEYVDANGNTLNLHQYVVSSQFVFQQDQMGEIERLMGDKTKWSPVELAEMAEQLYECGISCLDLIKWIERKKDRWNMAEYTQIVMRFHTVKGVFRCEKLLLLFMLVRIFAEK